MTRTRAFRPAHSSVPQALLDQIVQSAVEINGLRNIVNNEENHMAPSFDPNSYGKAGIVQPGCSNSTGPLNPSLALQAKAHRQQAAQLEAARKALKKAAKKAKRAEQLRETDVNLALDTFAEIASDPDANCLHRVEAARSLLNHYTY